MRTLAIGDIHGCNTALCALLEKASLWQSYGGLETLVSYGVNYADYGPDWVQAIPVAH